MVLKFSAGAGFLISSGEPGITRNPRSRFIEEETFSGAWTGISFLISSCGGMVAVGSMTSVTSFFISCFVSGTTGEVFGRWGVPACIFIGLISSGRGSCLGVSRGGRTRRTGGGAFDGVGGVEGRGFIGDLKIGVGNGFIFSSRSVSTARSADRKSVVWGKR